MRRSSSILILAWGLFSKAMGQETTVTEIVADGPGDTYQLLESKLGGSPLEVPDCDHETGFEHIQEAYDDELDRFVFKFFIHRDIDTDRCATNVDRQRNEIKSYDPSPDYLKAIQREIVTYEWLFKIDEAFQPSANFTHLFQLKSVGGNDSANPVLTITPRKGDPNQLQLIHGRGNNAYTTVAQIDLSLIQGKWVRASCEAHYADLDGKLYVNLSLLDGTEVLAYSNEAIDLWRSGASFVRPKWGIYRSLNDLTSLRDEEVLFADFKITEVGACPAWYEDADQDGLGDPNSVVYACERPDGYVQNSVDTCLDWYADSDSDGLGDPGVVLYACDQPDGYVDNADDLDDTVNDSVLEVTVRPDWLRPYPNPVVSRLYLVSESSAFQVFNLGGKCVLQGNGSAIDVSVLTPGKYVVQSAGGKAFSFVKL